MPIIQFETGQRVRFDGTPTQADIEEVARKLNIQKTSSVPKVEQRFSGVRPSTDQLRKQAEKSTAEAKSAGSFFSSPGKPFSGILGQTVSNTFKDITASEQGFGRDIAMAFGGAKANDKIQGEIHNIRQAQMTILERIKKNKAEGKDTSVYERLYNDNLDHIKQLGGTIEDLPTLGQVLGHAGGVALDIATAGSYGKAATGAQTGKLLRAKPSAVKTIGEAANFFSKKTAAEVAAGAGIGYGYDVTSRLSEGASPTDLSTYAPGFGTILGATVPVLGRGGEALSTRFKTRQARAVDSLQQTYEDINRGWRQTRKASEKAKVTTELKNKAGTTGRTPERVLAESGVVPQFEGDTFTTKVQADRLRAQTEPMRTAARDALREVDAQVPPISIDDLEKQAIRRVRSNKNIAAGKADAMEKKVRNVFDTYRRNYGDTVSLSSLDDIKSAQWGETGFSLTKEDKLASDVSYAIGKTAQETIEKTAAKAGFNDVAQLNREIGDTLEAAKFLENLDGRKVLYGRMGTHMLRLAGTITGASTGGIVGGVLGNIGGDLIARILRSNSIAGPIKRQILRNLEKTEPAVYAQVVQWTKQQGLERQLRIETKMLLPEPSYVPMGAETPRPSTVQSAEAARTFGRDPQTGQFKRVYTQEPRQTANSMNKNMASASNNTPINFTSKPTIGERLKEIAERAKNDQRGAVANPFLGSAKRNQLELSIRSMQDRLVREQNKAKPNKIVVNRLLKEIDRLYAQIDKLAR